MRSGSGQKHLAPDPHARSAEIPSSAGSPERAVLVGVDFTARSNPSANRVPAQNDESAEPNPTARARGPAASRRWTAEESLEEFRELVRSAGGEIVEQLLQRRPRPEPATLVGAGKVEEIASVAAATGADLILFDHDLSPTQLRNLEAAMPCRVLDRTQLILDIFARHARTREGQLQVELAQLEYMLPRLAGRGKAMSQLGGGIGTRGPGETQLETDRRKIQRRIDQLKQDLESVRRVRRQQRGRRAAEPVPTVAMVGYTNAGKSTLFNRLTGAQVLASSRSFATLDPKLRAIELPSRRKVLLSDTVGFIRNLPHTLITSFRATLEEVEQAEVLLQVSDAASPHAGEQKDQVEKVLAELAVLDKPRIQVLNKADLLDAAEREGMQSRVAARIEGEREVLVSARSGEGLGALLEALDTVLYSDPVLAVELRVPQQNGAVLAAIDAGMVVHQRRYEGNLVLFSASGPASLIGRLREFRVINEPAQTEKTTSEGKA